MQDAAVSVIYFDSKQGFLSLIVATRRDHKRKIIALVAANEDGEAFRTASDFTTWARSGDLRVLKTRELTRDQVTELRAEFIDNQLRALHSAYSVLDSANVRDGGNFPFDKGWERQARAVEPMFEKQLSPAFSYLVRRYPRLENAYLGCLHFAWRRGFAALSQHEREHIATDAILGRAGAKPYFGGRF